MTGAVYRTAPRPSGADLHVLRRRAARVLHVHHSAIAYQPRIQPARQLIGAEFLVKIPQHFGLGEGKKNALGLR
ncbi:hypothetical protein ACFV80_25525 [Streptomyces sp. NPDC059862]|uniref:hypothetical protein n=1 Tax=Streptomyces sp. NPDC059862 TaxID=3346975 RepID=UPI003647D604